MEIDRCEGELDVMECWCNGELLGAGCAGEMGVMESWV